LKQRLIGKRTHSRTFFLIRDVGRTRRKRFSCVKRKEQKCKQKKKKMRDSPRCLMLASLSFISYAFIKQTQ